MLTKLAIDNASLLRRLADPHPIDSVAALARELERDPDNTRKSLKALAKAGLTEKREGWTVDALSADGRAMVAALDRADGKAPAGEALPAGYALIAHAAIAPDALNPRGEFDEEALEELAASIGADGLLENLVVRPAGPLDGHLQPMHRLVAGERRWRAIGKLIAKGAWPADRGIPCLVKDMDDAAHARIAIIENLQRKDLRPLEEARGFKRLREEFGLSSADIAEQVKMTQRFVQQRLQLLELRADDMKALETGEINIEEARRRIAAYPVPLSPRARLVLAEFVDKVKRDPFKRDYGAPAVEVHAQEGEKTSWGARTFTIGDPAAVELVKRQILAAPCEITEECLPTGRYYLAFWYSGENAASEEMPEAFDDAARPGLIAELRGEVLGAEAAAALPEGRYAVEWLNGPFEMSAEAAKAIEETRAERRRREQEWEKSRAEHERREKEAKAERAKRLSAVAGLERDLIVDAVALTPKVTKAMAEVKLAAPLYLDAAGGDILDANGQVVYEGWLDDDNVAAMRLVVAVVNAAAGVETPAEAPWPRDPDAPTREQFVAQVAKALIAARPGLAERNATDIAEGGLTAWLKAEDSQYPHQDYDWSEEGAAAIAEGILDGGEFDELLPAAADTNAVREDAAEDTEDPEITPALARLAGVREDAPALEGAE